MSLAQKLYNDFLYKGVALDKSKYTAQAILFVLSSLVLVAVIQKPLEINILDLKKITSILPEVVIQKQKIDDTKKKFEILFVQHSPFNYPIEEKPLIEKQEAQKPIIQEPVVKKVEEIKPEPIKPKEVKKPIPPKKREVVKKKEEQTAPIAQQSEFSATDKSNSPEANFSSKGSNKTSDNALSQLMTLANKYKQYPKNARRSGAEGTNFILVHINAKGKITKAELAQTSGKRVLDIASEKLSKKLINSQLSNIDEAIQVRIPINYSLAH